MVSAKIGFQTRAAPVRKRTVSGLAASAPETVKRTFIPYVTSVEKPSSLLPIGALQTNISLESSIQSFFLSRRAIYKDILGNDLVL
jgi:hypothetical protein